MSTKGIIVSKDGRPVDKLPVEARYIDPDNPFFKLNRAVEGYIHVQAGVYSPIDEIIEHQLGYAPFFLLYLERNLGSNKRIVGNSDTFGIRTPDVTASVREITTDRIVFTWIGGDVTGDFNYTCFIYEERINAFV